MSKFFIFQVHRSGSDLSRGTDVWCSTKQADPVSATAGLDFLATSTKITFRSEETTKVSRTFVIFSVAIREESKFCLGIY